VLKTWGTSDSVIEEATLVVAVMRTLSLILGACLASGATAVRFLDAPKANVTAKFTAEDVDNAFGIVAFMKTHCTAEQDPMAGIPLPEGDFPRVRDFSDEAFKNSPCGSDNAKDYMPKDEVKLPPTDKGFEIMILWVNKLFAITDLTVNVGAKDAAGAAIEDSTAAKLSIDTGYATLIKACPATQTVLQAACVKAWVAAQCKVNMIPNCADPASIVQVVNVLETGGGLTAGDGAITKDEFRAASWKLITTRSARKKAAVAVALLKKRSSGPLFTQKDVVNAIKIVTFIKGGCKRITPGTPLPEGDFPTMEDFNPEALKMSPCGQDGESKIFDEAADESGEQGLAVPGPEFALGLMGVDECPTGYEAIKDPKECDKAAKFLKIADADASKDTKNAGSVCNKCDGCKGKTVRTDHTHGGKAWWVCKKAQ